MPSISRVRIVNLRYNEGSRLIPDVLMSFENSDRNTVDTLLDLENGGGKSVLVQLLLQTVIPYASVQGRRIGEYFQKNSHHSYILVEWKLDRSNDHLLTGIAMAASQNTDEKNESRSVRYYTFINHYDNFGDKYDIVNFPLSETIDGKMVVAQFNKVREMIKNSSKIEYYHSEALKKYQTRLEDHGIMHREWQNILVKVNEREGGIDKFIEEYNTTDNLLNNFIIPGVSNTVDSNDTETSIETMFLNYARSYSEKDDKLKLRDDISGFIGKLKEFQPTVRELWELSDKSDHAVRLLFDYIFSLKECLAKLEIERSALESEQHDIVQKRTRIRIEELSGRYHKFSEELNRIGSQAEKAEKEAHEAAENRDYYEHLSQVLYSAEKFGRLTKLQEEETALCEHRRQLENANMSGYAAELKYSLYLAAHCALNGAENNLTEIGKNIDNTETERDKLCAELSGLENEKSSVKAATDGLVGQRELLADEINSVLEKLEIAISQMLDESYDKADIEKVRNKFECEIHSCSDGISELDIESEELNNKYKAQQERLIVLNTEKNLVSKLSDDISSELELYYEKYNEVRGIVSGFSMTENFIFTDEPVKHINTLIADTNDKLSRVKRRIEMLEEQLENAENGTLHLPKSAVEHLASTGVDYQTGSAYLNTHEGLRSSLLENEPLIAFSVIVADDKARRAILDTITDESWIASAIPVFTLADIDMFTKNSGTSGYNFITAYSQEYFKDEHSYSKNIRRLICETKDECTSLENRLLSHENKLSILGSFTYSADFEKDTVNEQNELSRRASEISAEIDSITSDITKITERQNAIRTEKSELSDRLNELRLRAQKFSDICEKIEKLYTVAADIYENKRKLRDITSKIDAFKFDIESAKKQLNELYDKRASLENMISDYKAVIKDNESAEKTAVIDKPYSQLKTEYDQLRQSYSADIQEIETKLSQCRDSMASLRRELDDTDIHESEYSRTEYSSAALKEANENKKKFNNDWKALVEESSDLKAKCNTLGEKCKEVLEKISDIGGEVLAKSEIGSDFKERIAECDRTLDDVSQKLDNAKNAFRIYSGDMKRAEKFSQNRTDPYPERPHKAIELSENMIEDIRETIESSGRDLRKAENAAVRWLNENAGDYEEKNITFKNVVTQVRDFIENKSSSGDRYFTLNEKLEKDITTFESRRMQLDIALRDVEDSRSQLVNNCIQRSRKLYEDMKLLTAKSKVKIFDQYKEMIRITLPEIAGEGTAPEVNMTHYIDDCVAEFLNSPEHDDFKKCENLAHKYMGLRRLLNCYIGKEEIPVHVYKIDRTPQSSKYRTWENSLKANSGGERFVVFFALVLSMMNYSRGISDTLKQSSGVLILDNPFGPISSSHLLTPMFDIAKKFHIQLICLTHLGTAEIVQCFTNVYKLKLKTLPLSSMEILDAEPKQHMEHAYYRSEQLSFM